jgi:hypothetical protein
MLQAEPPPADVLDVPDEENFDRTFLAFFSWQYGQDVSSTLLVIDCSRTKSFPQASQTYS